MTSTRRRLAIDVAHLRLRLKPYRAAGSGAAAATSGRACEVARGRGRGARRAVRRSAKRCDERRRRPLPGTPATAERRSRCRGWRSPALVQGPRRRRQRCRVPRSLSHDSGSARAAAVCSVRGQAVDLRDAFGKTVSARKELPWTWRTLPGLQHRGSATPLRRLGQSDRRRRLGATSWFWTLRGTKKRKGRNAKCRQTS